MLTGQKSHGYVMHGLAAVAACNVAALALSPGWNHAWVAWACA